MCDTLGEVEGCGGLWECLDEMVWVVWGKMIVLCMR